MRILAILLKDLQQILRDKKSALFLVLMPILFTVVFGVAFSVSASSDSRLPVGWISYDREGIAATSLRQMLERSETVRLVEIEEKDVARVDQMVRDQKLAAALMVPSGFGGLAVDAPSTQPTLVALPNTPAGRVASSAVQSAVKRVLGAVEIAHMSAGMPSAPVASRTGLADDNAQAAFSLANAAWQQPPLDTQLEPAGKVEAKKTQTPQGFVQSSPGMIVQFAIFGLVTSAMVLVLERKSKTLQRMLTMPIRRGEIIGGHLLAMFGVGFLQSTLLVALGQFAFGVDYMREPVGTLLMMVMLSLWSASLGLLISAVCKKEEQVVLASLIAMFLFAALGGAWFPLDIAGQTFAAIGHVMPTAWAMDGFQNIVLRGLDWNSTLLPAGMLFAYTFAFFAVALWRFRFE